MQAMPPMNTRPSQADAARPGAHGVRLDLRFPAAVQPRGHDAAALVRALYAAGIVWRLGARGPRAFDCWSLTQLVQQHLFGRALMDVDLGARPSRTDILRAVALHPAHAQWRAREAEEGAMHGDVVTMAHRSAPWHVGTWLSLDGGVVLHCAEEAGLRVDDARSLRASGWAALRFYGFQGDAA